MTLKIISNKLRPSTFKFTHFPVLFSYNIFSRERVKRGKIYKIKKYSHSLSLRLISANKSIHIYCRCAMQLFLQKKKLQNFTISLHHKRVREKTKKKVTVNAIVKSSLLWLLETSSRGAIR